MKSGTSTLIAPEGEFQFQVTYEKAISLIPGLSEEDQGRTSSTYLSPQDVVAVLGKASSGEETYQEGGVSPFMTQLDYQSEGSPSSVTVLLSNMIGSRLSSLNFENLNSERLANKNGSLNREDFANIKIGTSYADLVNTVGIPSRVSWSSMMSSESLFVLEVIELLVKSRVSKIRRHPHRLRCSSLWDCGIIWIPLIEMNGESHDCTKNVCSRNYRFYWKCREENKCESNL